MDEPFGRRGRNAVRTLRKAVSLAGIEVVVVDETRR